VSSWAKLGERGPADGGGEGYAAEVGDLREVERVMPLLGVPRGGVPSDLRYGLFLDRRLLVEVRTEALLVGVVGVGVC
jgi:hypothetical protein